ncbi:hypothetical protein NCS52_00754400 [Fusarium sp. LHS14.1]|nr:hypothetical protein NCS52_00754400 [Fusarium sp. LHS14.1]
MGISAVASKPLGVAPRPIHFEMNLSTINDKSYDHRKITEAGFAPSNITLRNGELKPTSKALIPRHVGSVVLAKNGLKLCYDVIAFNYIAVHLFECMSAAYFFAFKDDPQAWINLLCEAKCTDVDINNQVSSCAGSTPQTHGQKRQSSASGGGEPKKQRSNNRGQDKNLYKDNNFNNADDDHDSDEDSDRNDNLQKPSKDEPPKKNLACPFQKLYPGRFPECEQRLLTNWDRVYQHLKRHHLLKKSYCPRCRKRFEDEANDVPRDNHIQRGDCQKTTAKETGLLLTAEYNKLKKLRRGTDEDKYKEAWGRLFSEEPCPKSFLLETELEMLEREAPNILAGFSEFVGMSDARKKEIIHALFRRGSAPIPDPTSISEPTSQGMGTIPVNGQAMGQAGHGPMPCFINPAMTQFMPPQAPHHATSYDATPSHQAPYQSGPYHSGPFSAPASSGQNLPALPVMSTDPTASTPIMSTQVTHGRPPHGFGSSPQEESNFTTGREIDSTALPELPRQVLMDSAPGLYPQNFVGPQNFQGQQHLSDQLSSMYPDLWWNLMNGNTLPNAEAGSSPDFGVNEDEDGPSSSSGYQGPGSGHMR